MGLLTSHPQHPLAWGKVVSAAALLWLAPVALGLAGMLLSMAVNRLSDGQSGADALLWLGFLSYALLLSPAFSWIGWLLALPLVALALNRGWFGWGTAAAIGAVAGAIAGAAIDSEIALAFGIVALLALRALLGRMLPI